MLFTEKDLLNAFKQNVDDKGWIYFVGNPDSNAKFIIDYMREHKEEITDDELDDMATYSNPYPNTMREGDNWEAYMKGFKAGYHKMLELMP